MTGFRTRTVAGILALLAGPAPAGAQTAPGAAIPKTAVATQTDRPPRVDGRLDDAAWVAAPVIDGFVQHEPREGDPVTERTRVRILFDAEAIYVGAWLFDGSPSAIVVGENRRDAGLDDTDAFVIVLDTFHDGQNAFVFGTTPAGIEYDGQVTREGEGGGQGQRRQQTGSGGGFNVNWDGSWQVATSSDSAGWYAEFRIPFSTLRYGRAGLQAWGLNMARHIRRYNEQSFWSPIPRQHSLYRISQAGAIEGIVAPSRRPMSFTPYLLSSASRDFETVEGVQWGREFGADAKLGLTSGLTLDLTYNTDFAQVEVDEQQVNLTRFNLFFPEKRPFFLENAGLFAVGSPQAVEMFFSRRVGIADDGSPAPILGGGRLTGKVAGLSIGILDIQTERLDTIAAPTNYGVVRIARELPNRSRIGALFVNRIVTTDTDVYNRTFAADARLGIGDAITFDGYAAATATPGRTRRDHAFEVSGGYRTRDWNAELQYGEVGEDFNPEAGFLERSGYRLVSGRLLRHVRTPGVSWLRELRPHASYRSYFDFGGFNETRQIHLDSHVEFANGAFFSPAFNFTREGLKEPFEIADSIFVPPGVYDNFEAAWRFNTNESAPISLNGSLDVGGFLSGHRKSVSATVSGRSGTTLAISLRATYNDVDLLEGSFETTLLSARLAYSFTPRIYLQSLAQYNTQANNWSGNFRFGWLGTAGTGFFLVYNQVERTGTGAGILHRTLIAKFSYQFSVAR